MFLFGVPQFFFFCCCPFAYVWYHFMEALEINTRINHIPTNLHSVQRRCIAGDISFVLQKSTIPIFRMLIISAINFKWNRFYFNRQSDTQKTQTRNYLYDCKMWAKFATDSCSCLPDDSTWADGVCALFFRRLFFFPSFLLLLMRRFYCSEYVRSVFRKRPCDTEKWIVSAFNWM